MSNPHLLSLNTYHYRRGGADAVYFDHDNLFRSVGWETAMFAMHHPNNESSPWTEYFADELEFGNAYSKWQKLKMAGKVIYSWEAKNKLAKLLDTFKPDVAHAHCIYHHLSPSVLSLLHERGIPTVMTAHDLKLACPAYKMLNSSGVCEKCKNGNLLHLIQNRCIHNSLATSSLVAVESAVHKLLRLYKKNLDRVVTPSKFFKDKLIDWGWKPEQLAYIPNYVDIEQYTPQPEPGDYFLYFGRLAPEKGVDTLIKAALQAGVKLRIAGTGPYEAELKALALDNQEQIKFLGFCSGDKLWRLIREASAVVLPSQWYENAPISILEAYASGKPVIGANIGGIPEMITENVTGFLYDSGSVEGLTKCLDNLTKMPSSEIYDIGVQARTYVGQHFTREQYLNKMLELYSSIR